MSRDDLKESSLIVRIGSHYQVTSIDPYKGSVRDPPVRCSDSGAKRCGPHSFVPAETREESETENRAEWYRLAPGDPSEDIREQREHVIRETVKIQAKTLRSV